MNPIQHIDSFETLKILGDARRLTILRLLMSAPATLSQLGRVMDMHPAKVRYHLKQLEGAGLVNLTSTRIVYGFVEKYYQATARAYCVNLAIVPKHSRKGTIIASGSHDLALDLLAQHIQQDERTADMFALPVGSLDGLIALRQGVCQLAGCHLFDPQAGEYNLPYVRHLFPGQPMKVVTLTYRQQGLMLAPGNPRQIRDLAELAREDITFINRNRGSGTRLWLDQHLAAAGVESARVQGYATEVSTHLQVAEAVLRGDADAGLGVLAAARQSNLDFIPLFEERYDLVIPESQYESALLAPALEYIHTAAFRQAVEGLGGYNPQDAGMEMKVN